MKVDLAGSVFFYTQSSYCVERAVECAKERWNKSANRPCGCLSDCTVARDMTSLHTST